jgi:hypothetical protein
VPRGRRPNKRARSTPLPPECMDCDEEESYSGDDDSMSTSSSVFDFDEE